MLASATRVGRESASTGADAQYASMMSAHRWGARQNAPLVSFVRATRMRALLSSIPKGWRPVPRTEVFMALNFACFRAAIRG
jgi:hypothetical protein